LKPNANTSGSLVTFNDVALGAAKRTTSNGADGTESKCVPLVVSAIV